MPHPMRETPSKSVPRTRKVRILATLGPASSSRAMILKLAEAGADAFRINMSHGNHKDHLKLIETVRSLEKELDRPTTILADLQGQVRVGQLRRQAIGKGTGLLLDRRRSRRLRRVTPPSRDIGAAERRAAAGETARSCAGLRPPRPVDTGRGRRPDVEHKGSTCPTWAAGSRRADRTARPCFRR